jgi:hypothetical protein
MCEEGEMWRREKERREKMKGRRGKALEKSGEIERGPEISKARGRGIGNTEMPLPICLYFILFAFLFFKTKG